MSAVTVVITTHNYGRYVGWALSSAFLQTAPPEQIIVVDDASTDDTKTRLATFRNQIEYVRVEFHNPQSARNEGLLRATGDYILFLDADDYLTPTALEDMQSILDRRPELKAVYGGRFVVGDEESIARLGKGHYWAAEEFKLETLRFRNLIDISALIRRRAFPGFDTRIRRLQDWEAWLGFLVSDNDAFALKRPTVHYRVHGQNLTFKRNELIERLKILVKHGIFDLQRPLDSGMGRSKCLIVAHTSAARDPSALLRAAHDLGLRGTLLCLLDSSRGELHAGGGKLIHRGRLRLVTVHMQNVESLLLSRLGYLGDPRLEFVALVDNLISLRLIDQCSNDGKRLKLWSSMPLSQIMEADSLEQLGCLVLNRSAACYLTYLDPSVAPTAIRQRSVRFRSWFASNVMWRFRHTQRQTRKIG